MKSRQLANVLIKVLGLYLILQAIPTFVSYAIYAITTFPVFLQNGMSGFPGQRLALQFPLFGPGAEALCGIVIILMSATIAGWMFGEDE